MGRAQERPRSASGSAWRLFPTLFTLRLVLGIAVGLVFNPEPSCQLPIQPGEGAIAADVGQSVGSPAVGNASGAGVAHGVFDMDAALLMVNFTRATYCDEGEIQNWSVPGPHPMARPCLGHRPTALQPFWAWLQSLSRSSAAADAAASLLPPTDTARGAGLVRRAGTSPGSSPRSSRTSAGGTSGASSGMTLRATSPSSPSAAPSTSPTGSRRACPLFQALH